MKPFPKPFQLLFHSAEVPSVEYLFYTYLKVGLIFRWIVTFSSLV